MATLEYNLATLPQMVWLADKNVYCFSFTWVAPWAHSFYLLNWWVVNALYVYVCLWINVSLTFFLGLSGDYCLIKDKAFLQTAFLQTALLQRSLLQTVLLQTALLQTVLLQRALRQTTLLQRALQQTEHSYRQSGHTDRAFLKAECSYRQAFLQTEHSYRQSVPTDRAFLKAGVPTHRALLQSWCSYRLCSYRRCSCTDRRPDKGLLQTEISYRQSIPADRAPDSVPTDGILTKRAFPQTDRQTKPSINDWD